MRLLHCLSAIAFSAFAAMPSMAHEFWIEATDYTIAPGDTLEATLRVGQDFEGNSFAYVPSNFTRFDLATGGGDPAPYTGRIGDRPALSAEGVEAGLATVLHVTRPYQLVWDDWQTFVDFTDHKAAPWVLDAHADSDLPREDVREIYTRFGKALVAVGEGAGTDRAHGLPTEIVALENPYTDDMSDGLDIRVFYDGAPRAMEQVEIFEKDAEGAVAVSTVTTDAEGRATVPVTAGRTYLLDSVTFRAPGDDLDPEFDPMWETLWASLTFAVPAE